MNFLKYVEKPYWKNSEIFIFLWFVLKRSIVYCFCKLSKQWYRYIFNKFALFVFLIIIFITLYFFIFVLEVFSFSKVLSCRNVIVGRHRGLIQSIVQHSFSWHGVITELNFQQHIFQKLACGKCDKWKTALKTNDLFQCGRMGSADFNNS